MLTKYKSGEYMLIKFNSIGKRKGSKSYVNYLTAKVAADKYEAKGEGRSSVVVRILYNSAAPNDNRWAYN